MGRYYGNAGWLATARVALHEDFIRQSPSGGDHGQAAPHPRRRDRRDHRRRTRHRTRDRQPRSCARACGWRSATSTSRPPRSTAYELGASAVALALDVTDRASFSAFLDAAEEQLGPLDVLVNNAGIMQIGRFIDEDDLHRPADGRHQPARRDPRHEARARADDPARPRPHRQHLLAGRQVRRARRRHLLGDQARRRRPDRGGARRAAADGRAHRPQLRDAGRRQHRARLGPRRGSRGAATSSRPKSPTRSSRRCSSGPWTCGCRSRSNARACWSRMLPRSVGEGIGRAIKADRVLAGADANVRREYELRAARSEPGLEPSAAHHAVQRRLISAERPRSAGGEPVGDQAADQRPLVLLQEVARVLDRARRRRGRSTRRSARPSTAAAPGRESPHSISVGRRSSRSAACTRCPASAPGASGVRGISSGNARAPAFDAAFG